MCSLNAFELVTGQSYSLLYLRVTPPVAGSTCPGVSMVCTGASTTGLTGTGTTLSYQLNLRVLTCTVIDSLHESQVIDSTVFCAFYILINNIISGHVKAYEAEILK